MTDKLKVGIVGVSGYAGGELARLLVAHPKVRVTYVTSGTYAGQRLEAALPGLRGTGLTCQPYDADAAIASCDLLFLAGEAGLAMTIAPALLDAGKKVIDLSADFRLKSPAAYETWYGQPHTAPQLLDEAVYGLPEEFKCDIPSARLVANPGCHVTAAVLALLPLLNVPIIDTATIVINSLSGVSGAGRAKFGLDYHFAEVNESMKPYGVGGVHRHTPEIEQALFGPDAPHKVTFTPHLVPVTRGILSTVSAHLEFAYDLDTLYRYYYQNDPFINFLGAGQFPATKHVQGTNFCHIGITVDKRTNRVIVISAIDNLVKGAAGQAVQNMNLMCGFAETDGLTGGAVWP